MSSASYSFPLPIMATNDLEGVMQSDSAIVHSAGYVGPYFEGQEHVRKAFANSTLSADRNVEGNW